MAGPNPFKWFRKHQKVALATLGVLAMLSFIVVPSLMQLIPGGSTQARKDIARCREFGTVNDYSVYALQQNRDRLINFYTVLYRSLVGPTGENRQSLYYLESVIGQLSARRSVEDLINDWLLTRYGQRMGVVVNNQSIADHLRQITGGIVSDGDLDTTMRAVGINGLMLQSLITDQMICDQIRVMFEVSQMSVTPLTQWNWFQRMNRKVTAEVAAVPVDLFVGKVADPSNAELQKFFDENKTHVFDPSQPESGFTVPNKVAFQYIKAVPSEKMLASISQEEIETFYDENKLTLFKKPVVPINQRPTLPGQMPGNLLQPGGAMPFPTPLNAPLRRSENVIKLNDDDPVPDVPIPVSVSGEMPSTDEPKPEKKPVNEPKPEEKPANEPKSEEKPVNEPKPEEKPANEPKPEEKPANEPKPEEKPANEPKPEEKPANEPQPEEKPTDESKTEEKNEMSLQHTKPTTRLVSFSEETPAAASQPAEETTSKDKKSADPPLSESAVVDLSILFYPLSEVEGQIRTILAGRKVDESISVIESKMRDYFHAFNINFDQQKEVPPILDLKPFAEQYDFEFFSTPKIVAHEAQRLPFAHGTRERQFLEELFKGAILFDPQIVEGDSAKYLFWVTDFSSQEEPESVDKVRDTVLLRWKEVNARPLAMKRAEELLEQAKTSGKPLVEAFANQGDVKVVETEPFTWKSYGESMYAAFFAMRGLPPHLGEVREKGVAAGDSEIGNTLIVAPGERFMETAYSLGVSEIGIAMNQPETVVYIIRVTGSSPSDDVLRERFPSTPVAEYRLAGMPEKIREARDAWLKQIQDEVGFKWINKPVGR